MKTAIINGKIITPHRILDQASLVMEDGVIEGIVKGVQIHKIEKLQEMKDLKVLGVCGGQGAVPGGTGLVPETGI